MGTGAGSDAGGSEETGGCSVGAGGASTGISVSDTEAASASPPNPSSVSARQATIIVNVTANSKYVEVFIINTP
ncbi:hypothetical protein C942_00569 [Photobacterium marinum]|uniref:Uncharacterized protein n=1 Tax=Photobacterium marinum TaxID=1056511 RepID=L8JCE0_9GAMM|nr:hypothetical protein C942_00569 [Photobacterium marinum]